MRVSYSFTYRPHPCFFTFSALSSLLLSFGPDSRNDFLLRAVFKCDLDVSALCLLYRNATSHYAIKREGIRLFELLHEACIRPA